MTLDDLIAAYIEARNAVEWEAEKRGLLPLTNDMTSAGVTSIVRALRDEFERIMHPGDDWNRKGIVETFNEILGEQSPEVKAAGGPASDDGRMTDAGVDSLPADVWPSTPAADASQVCEWTQLLNGVWTAHGVGWLHRLGQTRCDNCKLPIKFTEAK